MPLHPFPILFVLTLGKGHKHLLQRRLTNRERLNTQSLTIIFQMVEDVRHRCIGQFTTALEDQRLLLLVFQYRVRNRV